MTHQAEGCVDQFRIEVVALQLEGDEHVGAFASRVQAGEKFGERENAAHRGKLVVAAPARVSAAVDAFVVFKNRPGGVVVAEAERFQYRVHDHRVSLHLTA